MAFMLLLSGRVISIHTLIIKLLFHQTRVLIAPPSFFTEVWLEPRGRERVSYKIMKTSRESRLALSMYKIYITHEFCILWKSTFK